MTNKIIVLISPIKSSGIINPVKFSYYCKLNSRKKATAMLLTGIAVCQTVIFLKDIRADKMTRTVKLWAVAEAYSR